MVAVEQASPTHPRVDLLRNLRARCPTRPLIALGNCNLTAARALVAALRKGAV
ncbi:hypothetical protein ACIOWI_07170 [Streptomyces sp. NPDC087659]|uniref:hypothetical protein n=1 Tax=unclassified Streptomyces TaxID=2593676 RepID=UPI0036B0C39C